MATKYCKKCDTVKNEDDFYFQSRKHGLRQSYCKDCAREAQRKWRESNVIKSRESAKNWYRKKIIEEEGRVPRDYKSSGSTSYRSNGVFKRNKHLEKAFNLLPVELKEACENYYRICTSMNKCAGDRTYHVDHIIPINGENISGLHVPWNLRVTFATENASKGNKLIPEYWSKDVPTSIEDYVHDENDLPVFVDWERVRWPLDK